jgi:hypothetical protein
MQLTEAILMNKLIILLATTLFFVSGNALAQEAQAPGIVQLFLCKLKPGNGAANVWDLMETLAARSGDRPPGFSLFLWTPLRGYSPYDYVFGVTSTDLTEMVQGLEGYLSSGNAEFMDPRFAAVNERCDSTITTAERVKAGALGNTGDRKPDAVVETFVCRINAGSTMADVDATVDMWKTEVAKLGSQALGSYEATVLKPFRGSNGEVDFAWVGASPDLATWARGGMDYYNSKGGQAVDARFQKVSRCRNSVWTGYWIVPPVAQ